MLSNIMDSDLFRLQIRLCDDCYKQVTEERWMDTPEGYNTSSASAKKHHKRTEARFKVGSPMVISEVGIKYVLCANDSCQLELLLQPASDACLREDMQY